MPKGYRPEANTTIRESYVGAVTILRDRGPDVPKVFVIRLRKVAGPGGLEPPTKRL